MNSRWSSGEFETTIYYKDWPIIVLIGYEYYTGTTSGMGDDPSEVELDYVLDGTNTNIVKKLPNDIIEDLIDRAYEHGVNNYSFEHLYLR